MDKKSLEPCHEDWRPANTCESWNGCFQEKNIVVLREQPRPVLLWGLCKGEPGMVGSDSCFLPESGGFCLPETENQGLGKPWSLWIELCMAVPEFAFPLRSSTGGDITLNLLLGIRKS